MRNSSVVLWVAFILASCMAGATLGSDILNPEELTTTVTAQELGFDEILFVKRKPYSSDHYYTDINNGTSADRFLAGCQRHLYL